MSPRNAAFPANTGLLPALTGRWSLLLSYGLFAFSAALASGLVLRETMVTFHGLELVVGAYYGSWFSWIVAGALLAKLGSKASAGRRYAVGILLFPLAVVGAVVVARTWKVVWGLGGDRILPLEGALLGTVVATALPALLVGYLFPTVSAMLDAARPVSAAYLVEALGSVLGGVVFSFFFALHLKPFVALGAIGILNAGGSALWLLATRKFLVAGTATVVALIFGGLAGPMGTGLDRAVESVRWSRLQKGYRFLESEYTPYSHLAVGVSGKESGRIYGLFSDGLLVDVFPDQRRFARMAAHILAQSGRAPRRILLMGGGMTGLAGELLASGLVERLDLVLADPWETKLVRSLLSSSPVWSDPRLHLHLADARRFVAEQVRRSARYDAVVSVLSLPNTLAENRFFTLDFYQLLARLLPTGPFVQFFSRDEQATVPAEERAALASLLQTMAAAFGRAAVITGDLDYMVATRTGYRTRAAALKASYLALHPTQWPLPPKAFPGAGFNADLSSSLTAKLRGFEIPLNRDDRPLAVLYNQAYVGRLTRSRMGPILLRLAGSVRGVIWLALAFLAGMFFLRRFSDPDPGLDGDRRATWALGSVGMASMSLEVVLLVSFQQHQGALYRQVGLLGAATMGGLALGAIVGRFLLQRFRDVSLLGLLAAVAALALSYPWLLAQSSHLGQAALWGYLGLAMVTGLLTGAAFPGAGYLLDPSVDRPRTAGVLLEVSDHLGAALGAGLTGVLLFPVLGLQETSRFVAGVLALGSLPLVVESILSRVGQAHRAVPTRRWSFPWKRTSWILAAVVGASFLVGRALHFSSAAQAAGTVLVSEALDARMLELSSQGFQVKEVAHPFVHLEAFRADSMEALVVSTRNTAPDIRGYAGPVELIVTFGKDGTLLDVRLGANRETPSYVREVPGWLAGLKGWRPDQPLVGTGAPDTLTGVTVTTSALLQILDVTRRKVRSFLAGSPEKQGRRRAEESGRGAEKTSIPLAIPIFVSILLAALFAVSLFGGRTPRLVGLITSVAVLGLWLNVPLTFLDLCLALTGTLPAAGVKLVVFFAALASALLFGQIWCGSVCPFGALQEIIWLLSHPKGMDAARGEGQAKRISRSFEQAARYVKYLVLVLSASLFFLSANQAFITFDPMVWTFTRHHSLFQLLLLGALVSASLLLYRPWCRYMCPVGALLSLGNKTAWLDRPGRRWIPSCDLGVTSAKDVDCIRCNRCLKDR